MHITLSIQPPNKKYSLLRISKSFDGAFIVKKLVTISSSDKDPLQSGKAEIMFRIRSESQKKMRRINSSVSNEYYGTKS